ncbi:syncytin-1-like [Esox lucius]|uniref:syncytin-1-like n=1 Tax=Esox lucius TaxID=8010 RepID=UPI0014772B7B|nr:syncytin-1-like [Esox lucius]
MFMLIVSLCFLVVQCGGALVPNIDAHRHEDGHHGINTFLALSLRFARTINQSSCWICTHTPFTAKGGIPLGVIPFNQSEMLGIWRDLSWFTFSVCNNWGVNDSYLHSRGPNSSDPCWREPKQSGCISVQDHVTSLGVPVKSWRHSYMPAFDRNSPDFWHRPPHIVVTNPPRGWLCIQREQSKSLMDQYSNAFVFVGRSYCNQTADLSICDGTTIPECLMYANITLKNGTESVFYANTLGNLITTGMIAPNGTHFICGPNAYPWLPPLWRGSCYLGYVIPHVRLSTDSPFKTRHSRAITETERFFAIAFPPYGTAMLAREVISMASSLEALANMTSESLKLQSAEMVALRTVAMQNRLALDYILSAQGGTCAVIGTECCTYIPDNSEELTDLAGKIREEGAKYNNYNPDDLGFSTWLSSTFGKLGGSLLTMIMPVVVVVLVFFILITLAKCAVDRCLSLKVRRMLPRDLHEYRPCPYQLQCAQGDCDTCADQRRSPSQDCVVKDKSTITPTVYL